VTRENRDRSKPKKRFRASEQRLQDIVDNTTAVIFVKDLDLRYVLINREYERRFQVQPIRSGAKPTSTFILPSSLKWRARATGK